MQSNITSTHITSTHTTGQVARALGMPGRRLEGWAEQGLIAPKKQRGRTRHGDRRVYNFSDVMTAAVLAELQKLLGASTFRPGGVARLGVARLVAKHMHLDPFGFMALAAPALLVLSAPHGKLAIEVLYQASLSHLPPTAVVINLTFLADTIVRALE